MIKRNIVSFLLTILIAFMFLACSSTGVGDGSNTTPVPPEPVSKWSTEVVTDGEYHTGIAVDSDGKVHISCYDDAGLIYAGGRSTDWHITLLDTTPDYVGEGNDVSVGPDKLPQISYLASTTEVRLARLIGTNWNITTVDTGGHFGPSTAIAVDVYNRPHVVYYDEQDGFLKYAVLDGDTWTRENVAKLDNWDQQVDIAVDSSGRPHISYQGYAYPNWSVKYATRTAGGWQTTTVDADGNLSEPSIAVDTAGTPHLSYTLFNHNTVTDTYASALKYAVRKGSGWEITTVDVGRDMGNTSTLNNSSIAVDSAGHVHISYRDAFDLSLKYAYNDGTSWSKVTVDKIGLIMDVSWQTKIAVDGQNRPHISYFDGSHGKLMYSHKK